MQRSKIEWLLQPDGTQGFSWNPLAMRCEPISRGCDHCWHQSFAKRHAGNPLFSDAVRAAYAGGTPVISEAELDAPSHRKVPSRIALQLMGDLFFHKVTSLQQHAVFDAMMEAPQHTYFILTKRPCAMIDAIVRYFGSTAALPKHWWWGVSVEDMSTVHRAVELLKIGGGNIFVSAEPLLGDLLFPPDVLKALKWCIIGGETGHGARPVNFEWAVSLFGQCRESGIPYLAKNFPTILNPPLFVQPEVAQRMADAFKVREFPMELA